MSKTGRLAGLTQFTAPEWEEYSGGVYRCRVHLTALEGRFVATSPALPEVQAHGANEAEVLDAVTRVLAETLRARKEQPGGLPPLNPSIEPPEGTYVRWVIVHT